MLNNLPNLKIFSPYDRKSSFMAINFFTKNNSPCVVRCDKGKFFEQINSNLDCAEIIKGEENAIVSHGFFVNYCTENTITLKKHKIGLIGLNKIKDFNIKKFNSIIKNYKNIFFIDESWRNSSFGVFLSDLLINNKSNKNFKIFSLKNDFLKKGGSRIEILKRSNLDIFSILKSIRKTTNNKLKEQPII